MSLFADIWDNIKFEWQYRQAARKRAKMAAQTAKQYTLPPSAPPADTPFRYCLKNTCYACQAENALFVDKFTAHIESMRDTLHSQCANCGSDRVGSSSIGMNDVDAEVLAFWMTDEESYFWSQYDYLALEDIALGIRLEALDRCPSLHNDKTHVMIEDLLIDFRGTEMGQEDEAAAAEWLIRNPARWHTVPAYKNYQNGVSRKLERLRPDYNIPGTT